MHRTNGWCTEIHKSIRIHYGLWRGNFLKRILTYCTKYNETYRCDLNIQKHVSYAGSHKKISDILSTMHGNS